VDEQEAIVVCLVCSRVFPMTDEHIIGYQDTGKRQKPKNALKKIPPSKNLEIEQSADEIRITWWRCGVTSKQFIYASIASNSAAWMLAINAFTEPDSNQAKQIFSAIMLILSIILAYMALVTIFNRTIVYVDAGKITLEKKPLPVIKRRQNFSVDEIQELYTRRGKDDRVRGVFRYGIFLLTHDNDMPQRLICTKNINEALALEQQITAYLDNETRVFSLDAT